MELINENSGGQITLAQAKELVCAYSAKFPNAEKCFFIGTNNVKMILNQAGCVGIRIYNGYKEAEKCLVLVMIGVDQAGKDMTSGVIMDRMVPCPSCCDSTSSLNS